MAPPKLIVRVSAEEPPEGTTKARADTQGEAADQCNEGRVDRVAAEEFPTVLADPVTDRLSDA
jgi:hypothetical protein